MKNTTLPTFVVINNEKYIINKNGSYDVVLDIMRALSDTQLNKQERLYVALNIFYKFNVPEDCKQAIDEMYCFISRGKSQKCNAKTVMDWNKDFDLIADAVIPILGYDIRNPEKFTHWWTLVGAYNQIGDSPFAVIVSIRSKRQKGKKLEKWEQEFYRENREVIDAVSDMSDEEKKRLQDYLDEDW